MKHQRAPLPALVGLKNLGARDVGGHQVGRELDAAKVPSEQIGKRFDHHRLGQARHADDEHVSAGHEAREQQPHDLRPARGHALEQQPHDLVLADEHGAELFLNGSAALAQARHALFRRLEVFWIHGFWFWNEKPTGRRGCFYPHGPRESNFRARGQCLQGASGPCNYWQGHRAAMAPPA